MTRDEIRVALNQTGLYYDVDHPDHISGDKIANLAPPFMEWGTEDVRIRADGIDYISYYQLIVRVYTDYTGEIYADWKDHAGDEILDNIRESIKPHASDPKFGVKTVEEVLTEIAGSFTKEIAYDNDLGLYATTYTTEV